MATGFLPLVTTVQVIPPSGVEMIFNEGTVRRVNLAHLIEATGGPVFGPLRDPAFFAQAYLKGIRSNFPSSEGCGCFLKCLSAWALTQNEKTLAAIYRYLQLAGVS